MSGNREKRIEQRAYEIWEREGRQHGRHTDHWRRAEAEILAEERGGHTAAGTLEPDSEAKMARAIADHLTEERIPAPPERPARRAEPAPHAAGAPASATAPKKAEAPRQAAAPKKAVAKKAGAPAKRKAPGAKGPAR